MLGEIGKATAGEAMAKPLHNAVLLASEYYHKHSAESSGKLRERLAEQIGELLLDLQTPLSHEQRKTGWQTFEAMLRRYVELKVCGGQL